MYVYGDYLRTDNNIYNIQYGLEARWDSSPRFEKIIRRRLSALPFWDQIVRQISLLIEKGNVHV